MTDLELPEIQRLLSVPGERTPGHVTRRAFLTGALAVGGLAALPARFDALAAAATPVGADEGILILIHLGGGNDGLNTLVPIGDSRYRALRGSLAITDPLPIASGWGLHPALAGLRARYASGKVAVVRGVGQSTVNDLSHFSSTASWMAGTAGTSRTSGWLGRWLDGVPEAEAGLRGVSIGSSVPLHLVGQKSVVTALDLGGELFGADRSEAFEASLFDAVSAYGSGSTGKGTWADRIAAMGAASVGLAGDLHPLFTPGFDDDSLASQLTLVARLIGANLGIRVFNVAMGSFDTHDDQRPAHQALLAELDAGITAFYAALPAAWSRRVALATFSEFGRRPEANGSGGTDHGTSSVLLVVGDNVKGGLYGEAPSLGALDDRGDPVVTVDYRRVYASLLGPWLAGDPAQVLGATYADLGLFAAGPGKVPATPPPPVTGPWAPFATPDALVRQQYLDFYGRAGDSAGVRYWTGQLTSGKRTVAGVIDAFLHSTEFGRSVAPVARLALVAFDATPAVEDLLTWAASLRSGTGVGDLAAQVCAKPMFASRYGALGNGDFVAAVHQVALGRKPTTAERTDLVGRLGAGTLTRPALVAALAQRSEAASHLRAPVEVLMTYAGMLRRRPDAAGWTYWVAKVRGGTSIQRLIAQFFASSEYRRRFTS
ncbi:MAG: DUF1501 domain-containing protein [Acidimicrobiales bacterium]